MNVLMNKKTYIHLLRHTFICWETRQDVKEGEREKKNNKMSNGWMKTCKCEIGNWKNEEVDARISGWVERWVKRGWMSGLADKV